MRLIYNITMKIEKDQPNPIFLESNKRFAKLRKELFGTQEEAAKFLETSQAMISKIERGIHPLPTEHRRKLIKEKKLNTTWYDYGKGPMIMGEKEQKKNLVTNIEDLQMEIDSLKKEMDSMRTNLKIVLGTVNEIREKIK